VHFFSLNRLYLNPRAVGESYLSWDTTINVERFCQQTGADSDSATMVKQACRTSDQLFRGTGEARDWLV
jgi:hypothetical protein